MGVIVTSGFLASSSGSFTPHYIIDTITAQMYIVYEDSNGYLAMDPSSETTEYNPVFVDTYSAYHYEMRITSGNLYIVKITSGGTDCCDTVEDNNVKLIELGTTLIQMSITMQQIASRLEELETKEDEQSANIQTLSNGWQIIA